MNDLVRFAQGVQTATGKKRGRHPVFNSRMFYPYKEELRLQVALKAEISRYIAEAYAVAVNGEAFSDDLETLSNFGGDLPEDFRSEVSSIGRAIGRKVSESVARSSEMIVGKPYYPPNANEEIYRTWEANFQTLCKSAESDAKKEISRIVSTAKNEGWNGRQLEKAIKGELEPKFRHRAELIARTESAKLNGSVTRATYREMGCRYYVWMATMDERTRPDHQAMNGVICSVDDPTVYYTENPDDPLHPVEHQRTSEMCHLHPGDDFQCRCTSVAWDPEIDGQYEVKERPEEPEEKEPTPLEQAREETSKAEARAEKAENEAKTYKRENTILLERLNGANETAMLQSESFNKAEKELFEILGKDAQNGIDPKKLIEKATEENRFGLKVMKSPELPVVSLELANANAQRNANGYLTIEWDNNCQRSVIAYESRRRGYDVHATQSFENDILALANEPDLWTLVFKGAKMVMVEGYHPKTIEAKISQALKGYGPGSRVVIRYESKFGNEGHVFIGENIGGRVFYVEPQTGEFHGTEIFSGKKKNSFAYTRIDNLEFTEKIKYAVD